MLAFFRENFSRCWRASTGVSKRLTMEVRPAKRMAMKNTTAKSRPPDMDWKMAGMVMKRSGGPEAGSKPKAKTAGMTTREARMAAVVSNTAMFLAQLMTFSSLDR